MEETNVFSQSSGGLERSAEHRLLKSLAVLCGLVTNAGIAVAILTGQNAIRPPIALGDVSEAHIVEIRNGSGEAVLSGEFRSRVVCSAIPKRMRP